MYQIDNATAATSQPASTAAGTSGFFTDGNPATSTPATVVPAEWLNAVMMELANVVTGAGLTLAKNQFNQVLSAIKRLGQATVILADTGVANAYTATNATPLVSGTWVDGVFQQVKIAHVNTGASTYAPDGLPPIPIYGLGLQPLQQGELALNGTAVLMRTTIPGVNSGNPIAVLMECAGGPQQLAPATASQHGVQFGQVSGVVGAVRNLKMSVAAGATSATLTADEIIVETALGGLRYCLPNFNQTVSTTTTGIGGVVGTALAANGYAAIYAAYNPTTLQAGAFLVNANTLAPNIAVSPPAGWIATGLVSVVPLNGSTQFAGFTQRDRRISLLTPGGFTTATIQASFTPITVSGIPVNAVRVLGNISCLTSVSNITQIFTIASDSLGTGAKSNVSTTVVANNGTSMPIDLEVYTAQTLWYKATNGSGTPSYSLNAVAYDV